MQDNKKVVIAYGTFDLLHVGHIRLLERAKKLGDILYVGLSTDEFCLEKGKQTFFPYEERKEIVESLKFVDYVFSEETLTDDKIDDIKKYHADVVVWGHDWKGTFDYLNEYCDVVYVDRTEGISTTELKKKLSKRNG